ncbi:GxxExxY protein [Patescibacteria group bacterium]|nr:GxxExxY protein [Patescibacteria group bacterium]
MDKVAHKELSYKITGLLFKTHKNLGRYRNEKQYSDYFEELLKQERIKYVREFKFEDHQYGQGKIRCICDFIIEDKIILEFKAKNFITKDDYYQAKRYLITLNLQLAIIVNFRQQRIVPKRILNSNFLHLQYLN